MDPKTEDSLNIAYLNIMGQSKLTIAKQNQIEYFIKAHDLDILHLQESFIEESTFETCNFIRDNYQILFINNESRYGVCSIVHNSLPTTNEIYHPSGRLLSFNVGNFSFINLYLPSGTDNPTKGARENLLGEALPNLLIHTKQTGICGGDFNCIATKQDTTTNHEQKISPNLKRLISIKGWEDTFRQLHPKQSCFSHYYKRTSAEGTQTQGASRLDRSYTWGQCKIVSASYESVAFTDHFAHLVKISGGPKNNTRLETLNHKPNFKISPEVAKDESFIENVKFIIQDWRKIKHLVSLQLWWDGVKKDIKRAAKKRSAEIKKERKSELNLLMLLQTYYSKKVLKGNQQAYGNLKATQLKIVKWFETEAEKIKIFAQLEDIEKSEKVRIYHHELHKRTINKSTILKLKTPEKVLTGHQECANFLVQEVKDLWEKEVKLNEEAQEELLSEVKQVFTEEDNKLLEATISNQEIKDSLDRCNMRASPGTDSITYQTYKTCWEILGEDFGDVLREIVQTRKLPETMKYSYMIFTPKSGKGSPLQPKHLRKISLLNSDFKVLSGVYANRLKKMEEHTLSNFQFSVKPRKVTHAICEARDAIHSVKPGQKGCAVGEFDFQAAFDFLCLEGWTWRVLQAKGASPAFISTMKALYTDQEGAGYCIPVVNNEKMPRVANKRKVLKQGDRVSSTMYCYSADPLLTHLESRLQGITYHKLKTNGPRHPKLGEPTPVESKFKLAGYIDDIKTSISNKEEFYTIDNSMRLFEEASGCRLHRDPESGKCNILVLGKWSTWSQNDIPLKFLKLTNNLNFLGVRLAKNASLTRSINGEELIQKVKTKIATFKAGRFSPLACRPYAANTFVMSKLSYRAAAYEMRSKDLKAIMSAVKSWTFQDLLIKPKEAILHRGGEEGGLGLLHPPSRCLAILTKNFVDMGHPRSNCDNLFLKSLYRAYIIEDLEKNCCEKTSLLPKVYVRPNQRSP